MTVRSDAAIATVAPDACSLRTTSTLPSGKTPVTTSLAGMPTSASVIAAAAVLSPGSRMGHSPSALSRAMAAAEPSLPV